MRENRKKGKLSPGSIRDMEEAELTIQKYAAMVYRIAFARTGNREDAEDIFQNVFLRYIQKLPSFLSEEHRKAWLIRVTVNCANKFHTSFWQRRTGPLEEEICFESPEDEQLYEELMCLPDQYRVVIHLFYFEEMSIEEISRVTGTKPSTVRTRLTRARRKLKDIMEGEENV